MAPRATANTAAEERLQAVVDGQAELKQILNSLNEKMQAHMVEERGERVKVDMSIETLDKRVGSLETNQKTTAVRLDELADATRQFKFLSKILTWIGTSFGALIILLIWGLLTGQIVLQYVVK